MATRQSKVTATRTATFITSIIIAVLGTTSFQARGADSAAKPISDDVAKAWRAADASVGWMEMDELGFWSFRNGEAKGKGRIVPAFRLGRMKPGVVSQLPMPEVPFGLDYNLNTVNEVPVKELSKFSNLHVLNIDGLAELTDGDLKLLAPLKQLRALQIAGKGVTDKGVKELAGLAELETINLQNTRTNRDGIKALRSLKNLTTLSLHGAPVTDAGAKELASLKRLRLLYLGRSAVSDAGLKELSALTELRHLDLSGTKVTDSGLKHLIAMSHLQTLDLVGTEVGISDAGLRELKGLKELRTLRLFSSAATEKGLDDLRKAIPGLRIDGR